MEDLKTFIGVKMVQAKPMSHYQFLSEIKKVNNTAAMNELYGPNQEGYLVVYPDGYKSWSPKDTFESAYYGLSCDNVITGNDVANFIDEGKFLQLSDKSAVVTYTGKSGFEYNEISACVDPARFKEEIAMTVTKNSAMDKVWEHLGFVLQWAKNGLKRCESQNLK